MFGICNLSIVPCRKESSDKSEMVTQLLFGECFNILESVENWYRIKISFDEYECWIDKKQCHEIAEETFTILNFSKSIFASEIIQLVKNKRNSEHFPIVIGSTLPNYEKGDFHIENNSYYYEGSIINLDKKFTKKDLVETSMMYLNAPYLWGGKTPFGIDCSGFTQMVYKLNGIKLFRDAHQQANQGELLSFVEEAEPGDLAFFDNEEGRIVHVGIVINNNKIIHASGSVRIDSFDHQGIFNVNKKIYSHRLRLLKRIV